MPASLQPAGDTSPEWVRDSVVTRTGMAIPVRATARRPGWEDLPTALRSHIERAAGAAVVGAVSAGTGFTPGFASRLDLENGTSIFAKAASGGYDDLHGWRLTEAYREEIRKLRLLPEGIGAPALLFSIDEPVNHEPWVVLGLEHVDGRPPRRPWAEDELGLVTEQLTRIAPRLARVPPGLELGTFQDEGGDWASWLAHVLERDGESPWLDQVAALAAESVERCSGPGIAHLDLRDDNILIDRDRRVWICDWNFPMRAAPWIDLVSVLLSAFGDGLDVERVVGEHPLTRDVPPRSVTAFLANLWLYFTTRMDDPVPSFSPHLRDHQRWYAEASEGWLRARLGAASDSQEPARRSG